MCPNEMGCGTAVPLLTIEVTGEFSWDSTKTQNSLRTSGATSPTTSSRTSGGCRSHHLHQAGRQPLVRQRALLARTLGPVETSHHPTFLPALQLSLSLKPLPAHACSPELALQPLQRRGRLGQGHSTEADLLRLQGARSKGLLAWGDHSHLGGPDQRKRD